MNKQAKIYIAGHAGLVGSAITRKLKQEGYDNLVIRTFQELDLRRQQDVEQFFEQEKPNYVFLAAAKVGGILANNTYKAEFIYDNLMIAANIIHASYKFGVKKLLNLGSSCIYPKLAPQPLKEEYLLTSELEQTNEPYAIAKIAAIKLCQYYNEQYGTNFISVMPTNLYGPNDNFNLETSHVLPALIRKFHLAKLLEQKNFEALEHDIKTIPVGFNIQENTFEKLAKLGITKSTVALWGTGAPYREFLYVDDLTEALVFLMQNYSAQQIKSFVNIGTGKDLQIKTLAQQVKNIVGFQGTITWNSDKPDGTPKKLLDVSRMHSLGWHHQVELEKGIKKVYEEYLKRYSLPPQKGNQKALILSSSKGEALHSSTSSE